MLFEKVLFPGSGLYLILIVIIHIDTTYPRGCYWKGYVDTQARTNIVTYIY